MSRTTPAALCQRLATNNDLESFILVFRASRDHFVVTFGEIPFGDRSTALKIQPGKAGSWMQGKKKHEDAETHHGSPYATIVFNGIGNGLHRAQVVILSPNLSQ